MKKTRNNRWVKRGFCFGCQADEWGCRPIQPTPEMISPHMVSLYHFVPRLSLSLSLSLSLVHHSFLHVIQWICSVYSSIKKKIIIQCVYSLIKFKYKILIILKNDAYYFCFVLTVIVCLWILIRNLMPNYLVLSQS